MDDPVAASRPKTRTAHTTSTSTTASPAAGRTTTTRSSPRSAKTGGRRRSTSRSATSCRSSDRRQRPHRRPCRPDSRPLHQADLAHRRLSQFKLYDTSLARAIAKCGTRCDGPAGRWCRQDRLEKYIADNSCRGPPPTSLPLEAGVVDEDTYVEQGRDLERAYSLAGDQLHPRHAPDGHGAGDGRLPVHRRGLAPVLGPRDTDRRPTASRTRATT